MSSVNFRYYQSQMQAPATGTNPTRTAQVPIAGTSQPAPTTHFYADGTTSDQPVYLSPLPSQQQHHQHQHQQPPPALAHPSARQLVSVPVHTSYHSDFHALDVALGSFRDGTLMRLEALETTQRRFDVTQKELMMLMADSNRSAKEQNVENMKQFASWFERGHGLQMKAVRGVGERAERMEGMVFGMDVQSTSFQAEGNLRGEGSSTSAANAGHGSKSLIKRLDDMEYILLELLEKLNDPDAAKPEKSTRDIATSPHVHAVEEPMRRSNEFTDAGVDPLALDHVDAGSNTRIQDTSDADMTSKRLEMVDMGVNPREDTPADSEPTAPATESVNEDTGPQTPQQFVIPREYNSSYTRYQTCFPSSPYRPGSMVPAEWSRESSAEEFEVTSVPPTSPSIDEYGGTSFTLLNDDVESITAGLSRSPTPMPSKKLQDDESVQDLCVANEEATTANTLDQIITDLLQLGSPAKISLPRSSSRLATPTRSSQPQPNSPSSQAPNPPSPPITPPSNELAHTLSSRKSPIESPTPEAGPSYLPLASSTHIPSAELSESPLWRSPIGSPVAEAASYSSFPLSLPVHLDFSEPYTSTPFTGEARSPLLSSLSQSGRKRTLSISSMSSLTALSVSSVSSPRALPRRSSPAKKEIQPVTMEAIKMIPSTSMVTRSTGRPSKIRKVHHISTSNRGRPRKGRPTGKDQRPPLVITNPVAEFVWPKKAGLDAEGKLQKDYIQCDRCDCWYHFGCVGVQKGDPCTQEGVEFLCPPCQAHSPLPISNAAAFDAAESRCARPDCDHPHLGESEYFLERIIGRKRHEHFDPSIVKFIYLVKWIGYDCVQSTWHLDDYVQTSVKHIEEFKREADSQGFDVADPDTAILLQEAVDAGCF